MPRCPNGTRKNKQGNCVSHKERETQKKKRCPKGSRRHPPKTGVCVKNKNTTPKKSASPKNTTPKKNASPKKTTPKKSDYMSPKILTTEQIESVINEFSDDIDADDFFTESEKEEIIRNAKLNNITSKKLVYRELSKYHKGYGLLVDF